jgi:hypothetical protein
MTAPKRWFRWFRWSLRTMLGVVTMLGGLFGYHLNWIRQRAPWREPVSNAVRSTLPNTAPGLLPIFREPGESWIEIKDGTKEQVAAVQKLFPEAVVLIAGQQATEEQIKSYQRLSKSAVLITPPPAPSR